MATSDPYLALTRYWLERNEALHSVNAGTIDALLAAGTVRRHQAGAMIDGRGADVSELIVVLEGKLEISIVGEDGRRSICLYLPAGEWVNLIALVDGKPILHDLLAHTETVCMHVPRAAFLAALQSDIGFNLAILKMLCQRSRILYDAMAMDALLPLRARIARKLLTLMDYHGRQEEGGVTIDLKISQDEFAAMLGVSRHSFHRELKELQAENIVSIAYSHITVRNVPALRGLVSSMLFG